MTRTSQPLALTGPIQPAELTQEPPEQTGFTPLQETNLKLTQEQEQELVTHALARMEAIKWEMGLRDNDGRVQANSWLDIRIRNQQTNANDVAWRARDKSSIFAESNYTRGNSKRHCRLYAARVRDDLIGTRPFFGAFAQDGTDPEAVDLARDAEELAQQRIEESNVPHVIREGLRLAAIRNESVVKVSYSKNTSPFIGPAEVFVDLMGMPLRTPELGLLIYKDDDMLPDPYVEGLARLEKDPSFAMTQNQYETRFFPDLEQVLVKEDNVRAEVLDPRDFLCPLTAEDIHSADLVAHLREDTAATLNGVYGGFAQFETYRGRRAVTGRLQPRRHQNELEEEERPQYGLDVILVAEVYLRYVVDGQEVDIILVLDVENKEAVFYDYMANHMSRRPFTVIFGVEREPNRWYGIGVYSMMEHIELYTDTQFNRYNRADSQSGKIRWISKNGIKELRDGNEVRIGDPRPYIIDSTWDTDKPVAGEINLNSITENGVGRELMLDMDQRGEQLFGIYSNADASASNLNNSRTATGVMNNERNSNVLLKDSEIDHIRSIEEILSMAVEFLLENIPPVIFTLSMKTNSLVTLNREEIRGLKRKVKLLLTRSKSAEALQANQSAEAIALRYFRLSPLEQNKLRPLYVNQLRSLEVPDADQMLPEVTDQEVEAWKQSQAQAAAPPTPPSQSISFKYEDLARSEQIQLLQKAGIQPASDEELAEKREEEIATEKAMKPQPTVVPRPKTAA